MTSPPHRPCTVLDLGHMPFEDAYRIQVAWVNRKADDPTLTDLLLLVEHPSVITQGRRADARNVLASREVLRAEGIALIRTDRGGDVTYHGPGQTVGYPILRLEDDERDLHRYLRNLEEIILATLDELGVRGSHRPDKTGVWVDGEKICSIGIGVRRWITFHGFALNVTTDLAPFRHIVPCGLPDCRMTTIAQQLSQHIRTEEVQRVLIQHFGRVFGRKMTRYYDRSQRSEAGLLDSGF